MTDFPIEILKAISDYKLILRKNLPATKCATKMRELGIKRKDMKGVDEKGLYQIGLKIIKDLKCRLGDNDKRSSNSYQGAREFLQYLEELYSKYYVDGDRVVMIGQKSSCALVDAIQLIGISNGKVTDILVKQLKSYSDIIENNGTDEQKRMFFDAVSFDQNLLKNCFPKTSKILT